MPFVAGKDNSVEWKPAGANSFITLNQFRRSWRESNEGTDVTSSIHGGVQAVLATILRGEGSVSFHTHTAQMPYTSSNLIRAGLNGILRISHNGLGSTQNIPVLITSVDYQNEIAGGCDHTFTVKLNQEAATVAEPAYTYPGS